MKDGWVMAKAEGDTQYLKGIKQDLLTPILLTHPFRRREDENRVWKILYPNYSRK